MIEVGLDWIFSVDGLGLGRIIGFIAPPAIILALMYLAVRNYLYKRRTSLREIWRKFQQEDTPPRHGSAE
jgi:hypothetical protein